MAKSDLIDNLIKLSDGKLFLLKQLSVLTQQQSKNIDSEEAARLNDIIEQKQNIMKQVDVLDKDFLAKYDLLRGSVMLETLDGLQANEKDKMKILKDKITEIHSITEKIHKLDTANVEKLKKNLKSVQAELEKTRVGKKVLQGYTHQRPETISIFVDEKQ